MKPITRLAFAVLVTVSAACSGSEDAADASPSNGGDTGQSSNGPRDDAGPEQDAGSRPDAGEASDGGTSGGSTTGDAGGNTNGTTGSAPGACEAGTSTTTWATNCATAPATACVQGTWQDPGSTTNDPVQCQSTHFVVHAPSGVVNATQCQAAIDALENDIWPSFMGAPIFFPEPYCQSATKYKVSIVIHADYGLTGGTWGDDYMGMWIGPGATGDRWGLAHEFTHALQGSTGSFRDCKPNTCGWVWESHANWHAHQLEEYRDEVHCSEMLVNFPHLYYGSTRNRYCNWQFFEFLKDKLCYAAVEDLWKNSKTLGADGADPFLTLMRNQNWSLAQLNDFFGEWALHNVTWDYQNPDGSDQGAVYRKNYGATDERAGAGPQMPMGARRQRVTVLDALESPNDQARFVTPAGWAPQRWGYNVVRLYPDAAAERVKVTFRGVVQAQAGSDWRWGLVAVDATGKPRYSPLRAGSDGVLDFCISAVDKALWLVVVATPNAYQSVYWDQLYKSIYRYPWMVELAGALPETHQANAPNPTSSGMRWPNGGGWVASGATVASSAYVGPGALVLGGNVQGNARIDGHAVVLNGTVSDDAVVDGLSVITGGLQVSGTARVSTTFLGPGSFESNQRVSGSAKLIGDIEYRGQGINKSSGVYYGFVDEMITATTEADLTLAPPYTWRP